MHTVGPENSETNIEPLPEDPEQALIVLHTRSAELPFDVSLASGTVEEAAHDRTLRAIAERYPNTLSRVAEFSGRAVARLMKRVDPFS